MNERDLGSLLGEHAARQSVPGAALGVLRDGEVSTAYYGVVEALPLDDRTFLLDPLDPDDPTVTFGAFAPAGRPQVCYLMFWALPRLDPSEASR